MPDQTPSMPPLPTISKELLDTIGHYGMARTDRVSEVEVIHRWQQVLIGIKRYAHAHSEQCVRAVLEQAAKAAGDVDEPPWTGYECPNTFQDGVIAAVDAVRALAIPTLSLGGRQAVTPTCPTCGQPLPRPRGRPTVPVDTERARQLLAEGNSIRTVASYLGVSDFTLRKRLANK